MLLQQPVLVTAPLVPPVSLAEVKLHLRVDHNDEDSEIAGLIDAATAFLDGPRGILGKCLIDQGWRQSYSAFCDPLPLPPGLGPVSAVTKLEYYDTANVLRLVAPTVYTLHPSGPWIMLQAGQSWPGTYSRSDAVAATFTAGYGDPVDVPGTIRLAMKLLIGDWYANREATSASNFTELPFSVRQLLVNFSRPVI